MNKRREFLKAAAGVARRKVLVEPRGLFVCECSVQTHFDLDLEFPTCRHGDLHFHLPPLVQTRTRSFNPLAPEKHNSTL